MMRTTCLFTTLATVCVVASALVDCDDILRDAEVFVGACSNKWHNLKPLIRPTQKQIGYAWVEKKLRKYYRDEDDAQERLDEVLIPAILGPSAANSSSAAGAFFIVDHHHELAALDYSGFDDVSVTVEVLCDLRHVGEAQFWRFMEERQLVFLLAHPADKPNALPVHIPPAEIPTYFAFTEEHKAFSDDPWRSLASFVRKVKIDACAEHGWDKYCYRCYVRECEDLGDPIPFFEFRWAYFFNEAFLNPDWWPSEQEFVMFEELYAQLPHGEITRNNDDDDDDEDDDEIVELWEEAAESLIPLCRAESTASYLLPSDKFQNGEGAVGAPLPGYVQGWKPLPEDPTCIPASCTSGGV